MCLDEKTTVHSLTLRDTSNDAFQGSVASSNFATGYDSSSTSRWVVFMVLVFLETERFPSANCNSQTISVVETGKYNPQESK